MLKPRFRHHTTSHDFIGQIAFSGELFDVYTGECDEYGETIWIRSSNDAHKFQTMPVAFIDGGGMLNTALRAAKDLLLTQRAYSKSGLKLGSLNELI